MGIITNHKKSTKMENQSTRVEISKISRLEGFIKKNPKFQESRFFQGVCDADNRFDVNGKPMNKAIWNLILSKRDLCLYEKCNMIPHRNWRITDVKTYFGLTGTIKTLLPKYLELCDIMLEGEDSGKNPLKDKITTNDFIK